MPKSPIPTPSLAFGSNRELGSGQLQASRHHRLQVRRLEHPGGHDSVLGGLSPHQRPVAAGRLYEIQPTVRAFHTNNDVNGYLRVSRGAATSAGVNWSFDSYAKAQNSYGGFDIQSFMTVTADGNYTLTIDFQAGSTASVWTDLGCMFSIKDIGTNHGQQ